MEELIIAIQELGQQTWMDYANVGATIVGILVSIIAVIVAISVPNIGKIMILLIFRWLSVSCHKTDLWNLGK